MFSLPSKLSLLFYTFFLLLLGFFFLPFPSFAQGILDQDFDTFTTGDLCSQFGTQVGSLNCPLVYDLNSITPDNSILFGITTSNERTAVRFTGSSYTTGTQSFWVYPTFLDDQSSIASRYYTITFQDGTNTEFSFAFRPNDFGSPSYFTLRPTSTDYFNFTNNQWHNINVEWTNTEFRIILDFVNYSPWLTRTSNGNVNSILISDPGSPDQAVFYFDSFAVIPENYLAQLSFVSPSSEDFVQSGEQTISGTCKNVGTNQLFIFNRFITDPLESYFTIECESDYTWSTTYDLEVGNHELWIFDKDFLSLDIKNQNTTTTSQVVYTGFNASSTAYQLGIVYPTTSNGTVYQVQYSDDFPFQFSYTLPSYDLATSTRFILEQYTDSTFTTIDSTIANNSIEFFDFDYVGRFTIQNGIIATTTPTYYEATLWEDINDTLVYKIRFQVIGSSDPTTPAPIAPDVKDCGLICNSLRWAFVPSRRFFHDYSVELPQLLSSAIPFSYFYQVKDILNSQSVTSDSFALSFYYKNNSSSTIDVFNPQNSTVQEFSTGFRPFIIYGLWIMFCIYLVIRVMDFHI